MTIDELMEKLYEIYEGDCGCDGDIPTNVVDLDFDGDKLTIDVQTEEE